MDVHRREPHPGHAFADRRRVRRRRQPVVPLGRTPGHRRHRRAGAPTIDAPAERATLATHTLALSGTTEAGTTVAIFEGATKLGDAVVAGGTWTFTTPALADGGHDLKAVATDGNGDTAQSAVRHVTIDTVAPEVTFSGVPASPTNLFTFDIGFTANDPTATFDCVHVFPDGSTSEQLGCDSPFEMRELTDGVHELRVTAKDAFGNARDRDRPDHDRHPAAGCGRPVAVRHGGVHLRRARRERARVPAPGRRRRSRRALHRSAIRAGARRPHALAVAAIDAAGNRSETTTRAFTIPARAGRHADPDRAMPAPGAPAP